MMGNKSKVVIIIILCGLNFTASAALEEPEESEVPQHTFSSTDNVQLPFWARKRSADILLDFSKADAAAQQLSQQPITFRGQVLNATHNTPFYHGNVAILRHGSNFYIASRQIQFYITLRSQIPGYSEPELPSKKFISWWNSRISLCKAHPDTLLPQSCKQFDPRNWTDCLWNGGFESLGPEDPRLIQWPGKGLFLMFISKPWPVNPGGIEPSDTKCSGPWAQQPWLMPLVAYPQPSSSSSSSNGPGSQPAAVEAGNAAERPSSSLNSKVAATGKATEGAADAIDQKADAWLNSGLIRLQYMPAHAGSRHHKGGASSKAGAKLRHHGLHKEKNWNPFIHNNELYFSQSFDPHVVIKPAADGVCSKVHETESPAFQRLPAKPKGNTQAVLLPAAVTGAPADVYIGIIHIEVNRTYTNYFYKMQAQPPFKITAISDPIGLVPGQHPRIKEWTHISFPMSLQLLEETQQLMIGYGSGDQHSRVRLMGLEEVLQLFTAGDEQPVATAATLPTTGD